MNENNFNAENQNTILSVNETPTTPNPTGSNPETGNDNNQQTPKKSNNITMIIGGIVLLIVIVVVVYFVFIKKDNNNNNDQVIDRTKEIEEATKKAEEMDNNVNVVLLDKLSSRDFAVEIEKQKLNSSYS